MLGWGLVYLLYWYQCILIIVVGWFYLFFSSFNISYHYHSKNKKNLYIVGYSLQQLEQNWYFLLISALFFFSLHLFSINYGAFVWDLAYLGLPKPSPRNCSPCVLLYNIILTNYVLSWVPFGTCDCITHPMIFTLEAFDDGIQNSKDVPSWFRPLKCRNLGNDSMIGVYHIIIFDLHLVWLCWPLIMPKIVEKFNFYQKSNIYSTSSCIDFGIFWNILHRILIQTP